MHHHKAAALAVGAVAIVWAGFLDPVQSAEQRKPRGGEAQQQAGDQEKPKAVPRPEPAPRAEPQPEPRAVPRGKAERRSEPDRPSRPAARRAPPQRNEVPRRYLALPRPYYFPPIDVRLGFYYHPYFGFYHGPYYGPFYPYPGPFFRPTRYSASAIRTRVKPVEAEVYVNGYYAGIVDDFDGVFQRLYVPSGQHRLELRLAGYESFGQDLYVSPGDTLEINHQMRPLRAGEAAGLPPAPRPLPPEWTAPEITEPGEQPASPYGILALRTEPADAQIVVDGEAWDGIEGQPEFVIHLSAGWHQLEVRKEGYQAFSTRLELSEGQTTRLSVTLEK